MGQREGAVENVVMGDWPRRSVLVTGATGLLGSWLTDALVARGASVVCLVRDWVPRSRLVESGTADRVAVVRGELEDPALLVRVVNEYEVDTVFHLGAQTVVGTAARSPASTFETNVRGTWNMLEACRTCPALVRRVVVASSDKAYGDHGRTPYREDLPLLGHFPYDVSKACADLIARSYFLSFGTPVVVTRCGNLYGGGDLNFNRLIPGTVRSALAGEAPVVRSDGTYVRDYFYVADAVEAYLCAADAAGRDGVAGEAFNFGNDNPLSVLDVVATILRQTGRTDLSPVVLNQASREIPYQSLDCGKARRVLGWRPRHDLASGLTETIAWYREWLAGRPRKEGLTS